MYDIDYTKALLNGAVLGLGSYLIYGADNNAVRVWDMEVPAMVPIAASGIASSILADEAHKMIVPHISKDQKWQDIESAALGAGLGAASTGLTMMVLGLPRQNLPKAATLGAVSYIATDYGYHKWFGMNPQTGTTITY